MDPTVADSIQVSLDTLQVLEMQSDTLLVADANSTPLVKRPSFYVAIFTGLYMVVTGLIFWKTWKQSNAAQKAAEASQASNIIQKRASFYPTFDMELGCHGTKFQSLVPRVILADENAIFNSYLYVLMWYGKDGFNSRDFGYRIYANPDKHSLLWGCGLGNITSKETQRIKAKMQIDRAYFLLRFSDGLGNTYYRYQHFRVEDNGGWEAQPYTTITTQMEPTEEYKGYAGEKGIYFIPSSDIGNGGVMTREEAKEGYPKPVKVFSEKVYSHAAGGLGPIGEALTTQRG